MSLRTLRFPAKMNRSTHEALDRFLDDQRHLWNAALQERIEAHCDGAERYREPRQAA